MDSAHCPDDGFVVGKLHRTETGGFRAGDRQDHPSPSSALYTSKDGMTTSKEEEEEEEDEPRPKQGFAGPSWWRSGFRGLGRYAMLPSPKQNENPRRIFLLFGLVPIITVHCSPPFGEVNRIFFGRAT
jgi:hypothetical protein